MIPTITVRIGIENADARASSRSLSPSELTGPYGWTSIDELGHTLAENLSARHPGEVTELEVSIGGDTVVLYGEVASEGCRGDLPDVIVVRLQLG